MRPDQIELLTTLSAPTVHPDGSWAVVAAAHPSFDADAYTGQLWRVPLDGSGPQRLTRGFRDAAPRFSPDGSALAFLRTVQGERPQLQVLPAGGGEPVCLTDQRMGVGAFAWSPDGRRLAFLARVAEEGRYGTLDGVGSAQEDPRRITTFQFQANGLGYTADQRVQLFVVDVPDLGGEPPVRKVGRAAKAEADGLSAADAKDKAARGLVPAATRLTDDAYDYADPAFRADGEAILVTASRHEGADDDLRSDLYVVPVGGGDPTAVTRGGSRTLAHPVVAPGGEQVFLAGTEVGESGRDFVGRNEAIYVVAASGGEPRVLTDAAGTMVAAGPAELDAHTVLAVESRRGATRVLRVGDDGRVSVIWDAPGVVSAVAAVPGRDAVVAAVALPTSPGELVLVERGAATPLTDFAAGLRDATMVVEPREVVATAPDGYPVHGWAYLPAGEGPHPVILNIHGGPFASYGVGFFDEVQVYTAAGYAVLQCNPRGSAGYGEAHGQAIKADMGNLDMADILAFLDHCLATVPGLDADRVGVMGGSYGGYMTAWLIGHDHRWRGAIVERGFLDVRSFVGSSDIGWFFVTEYNSDDPARMDAQSPMTFVGDVTTPTLIIHSEQDIRCPIGPALRYYTELKRHGVEAELLVFPGENHELSRSGTPWHRRQRFEAILDWWSRHL